jgi:hypothetical protein
MRSSDRGTVVVQPPRPRYFDKVFICEPRSADRTAGTGMVLCEQHDEWAVVRRYMSAESLAKARLEVIDGEAIEEVRGELVAAS